MRIGEKGEVGESTCLMFVARSIGFAPGHKQANYVERLRAFELQYPGKEHNSVRVGGCVGEKEGVCVLHTSIL